MEGDPFRIQNFVKSDISIHSLRMEGDVTCTETLGRNIRFQSTPSAWRETQGIRHFRKRRSISIHSLRMEGDFHRRRNHIDQHDFNPLPPHGGRPSWATLEYPSDPFQSTPSAWRETECQGADLSRCRISIHSLRMEGDSILPGDWITRNHFNPLPPHGGRHNTHS